MIFPESKVRLNSLWFLKLPSSPNAASSLNTDFLPHPVSLVYCFIFVSLY